MPASENPCHPATALRTLTGFCSNGVAAVSRRCFGGGFRSPLGTMHNRSAPRHQVIHRDEDEESPLPRLRTLAAERTLYAQQSDATSANRIRVTAQWKALMPQVAKGARRPELVLDGASPIHATQRRDDRRAQRLWVFLGYALCSSSSGCSVRCFPVSGAAAAGCFFDCGRFGDHRRTLGKTVQSTPCRGCRRPNTCFRPKLFRSGKMWGTVVHSSLGRGRLQPNGGFHV
jgi:hypothetical protein